MDQELRNALRRTVNALRELLEDATRRQLESTFGILPDGSILDPERVPPLKKDPELRRRRGEIETAILHERHHVRGNDRDKQALEKFVREAAFTQLNRLAALKLMERRKLVPECIARGEDSEGYKLAREVAPSAFSGPTNGGYALFLSLLYDDIANEVRALFDRTLPQSYLLPDDRALADVLKLLNDEGLGAVWEADETLGWVYQYFTPKELREDARRDSPAPRNSYELAFRNQFYTPEYVVRFLVENTLGRLWWEMHPETSLKQRDYMVYQKGEEPQTRPPRDPRDLRILDPACGSGHFLHYAFELLQVIYAEAYDGHPAGDRLRKEFRNKEALERAVPGLILAHNLYGIDIDLRSTQLTALSLYLRAKRAHPEAPIRRVNAALAAPVPGDAALFEGFLQSLEGEEQVEILRGLLRGIWEELGELAPEAGSLLKAERAIRDRIAQAQDKVEKARVHGKQIGMKEMLGEQYDQGELPVTRAPEGAFWGQLEEQLVALLRRYAEGTEAGGVARRLFAEDAAHGIAFLDALMQPYDVVLMNPPFGAASIPSKKYVDKTYPRTKNDVYAAFVERGLELLRPGGFLGAITSRTGFFLTTFQKWREEILLKETKVIAFADLGGGVLDTAMVETAAYVLEKVRIGP